MTHTPTPWQYDQANSDKSFWIVTDKKTWLPRIAHVPNYEGMPNEANAAFIVKAVNNHEKLVEALRLVRGIIVEASAVGFNYKDGDWAERLYASQGDTANALKDAGETL